MFAATRLQENRLISDLAADLTDPALAILIGGNVHGDTVAMELSLWHALRGELERELRFRRVSGNSREYSSEGVLEVAVHRAVLEVASSLGIGLGAEVLPLIARFQVTARQRAMAAKLLADTPQRSPRPLGRSGLVRQSTVTALNG